MSASSSSSSSRTRIVPFGFMDRCDTLEEFEPMFDMLSKAPLDYSLMMFEAMKFLDKSDKEQGVEVKKPLKEAKENDNALYFKIEVPKFVTKENIEITVKNGTLTFIGSVSTQPCCKGQMFLRPPHIYKVDQIKAEFKNGVLNIVIPKDKKKNKTEINNDELITVKVD